MKKRFVTFLIVNFVIIFAHSVYAANGTMPGNGTFGSPWLVEDIGDFEEFCSDVSYWSEGVYVQLVCDLDLSGVGVFSQALIGSGTDRYGNFNGTVYEGVFNGNYHVISNLTVSGSDYCGLFGRINAKASIRNVALYSCSITGTKQWVGGLVGYNNGGIISNCLVIGSVSGEKAVSDYIGGLVGFNKGTTSSISNCNVYVTVKSSGARVGGLVGEKYSGSIINCSAVGTVTGLDSESNKIGGLVGYNFSGRISGSYADATVESLGDGVGGLVGSKDDNSAIDNCYATSSVKGKKNVGGLVGYNIGKVSFSYFSGTVSGSADNVGGLIGNNEAGRIGNCYAWAGVTGEGNNTGGLIGFNNDNNIIYCYSKGTVDGYAYVGGLVGHDTGNISYCNAACTSNGTGIVGGLVGFAESDNVSYCYSEGTVGGTGSVFGGLVGYNISGIISNCNSTAEVTCDGDGFGFGGLVGGNLGRISNCYASGAVDGNDYVGGLCGFQNNSSSTIEYSFWDTETTGQTLGYNLHDTFPGTITDVEGLSTSEMQDRSNFIEAGWDFNAETDNGINNTWVMDSYPVLCWQLSNIAMSGNGSEKKPFVIGNIYDFYVFCSDTNYWEQGVYTKMNCDLDLSDEGIFIQSLIGGDTDKDFSFDGTLYAGNFNGNSHVISNLTVSGSYYCGLFGKAYSSAEISNLGLENVSITGVYDFVGGMVGFNAGGSVSNCCVTGTVRSYNDQVGGIVGRNEGSIGYSYSSATVTGIMEYVGGLTGNNTGSIRDSYFTGLVDGYNYVGGIAGRSFSRIEDCYSIGAVSGTEDRVCGLCGYQGSGSSLVNCVWNTDTASVSIGYVNANGGIVLNALGKTTGQMQVEGTFSGIGWDFAGEAANGTDDVWHMPYEATGYPMLWWQKDIPGDIAGSYGVDIVDFDEISSGWLSEYGFAELEQLVSYWLEK